MDNQKTFELMRRVAESHPDGRGFVAAGFTFEHQGGACHYCWRKHHRDDRWLVITDVTGTKAIALDGHYLAGLFSEDDLTEDWFFEADSADSDAPRCRSAGSNMRPADEVAANACLLAAAPELLAALRASKGHLMNALIDLQTNTPKQTAINTIRGGIEIVSAAIAKAEGDIQ